MIPEFINFEKEKKIVISIFSGDVLSSSSPIPINTITSMPVYHFSSLYIASTNLPNIIHHYSKACPNQLLTWKMYFYKFLNYQAFWICRRNHPSLIPTILIEGIEHSPKLTKNAKTGSQKIACSCHELSPLQVFAYTLLVFQLLMVLRLNTKCVCLCVCVSPFFFLFLLFALSNTRLL